MLRDDQVELTRQRILDAVWDLAITQPERRVSVAEVARTSGISPATIYRHFPNRDALVHAAANRDLEAGVETTTDWTIGDVHAHLEHIWSGLAANLPVAREAAISEAGREMRHARYATFRAELEHLLDRHGIDPHAGESSRAIAVVAVLASVHCFIDLHDRQALDTRGAVDTAIWGIERILTSIGIDLDAFALYGVSRNPDPTTEEPNE